MSLTPYIKFVKRVGYAEGYQKLSKHLKKGYLINLRRVNISAMHVPRKLYSSTPPVAHLYLVRQSPLIFGQVASAIQPSETEALELEALFTVLFIHCQIITGFFR